MRQTTATYASAPGWSSSLTSTIEVSDSTTNTTITTAVKFIHHLFNYFFSYYYYYDITEIDGVNTNELYNALKLYLSSAAASSQSSDNR
ncbi:hypothetical protein LguiA_025939 [Lonicera macranthoides]